MKYYVVSDVHGYCTEMERALREVGYFEEREPHRLVVCGDLLDRGAEARRLIEFMVEQMEAGRLIYILGNHEDLLVDCLQELARGGVYEIAGGMSHHFRNRTWDTLLQIAEMEAKDAVVQPNELVRRVMRSPFYRRLLPFAVDVYETERYVFTHGWIPCFAEGMRPYLSYRYDPDWRNAEVDRWRKARWYNGMELWGKHGVAVPEKTVVCGHWHASYGHAHWEHKGSEWGDDADFSPFRAEGILAMDACTALSGRVNCICLED